MESHLLADVVVMLALATAVLIVCHFARLPTIVGFILTGILAGPHGAGMIEAVTQVELLAEIGVVLLLFSIGIEFSLEKLMQTRKSVLVAGPLQMVLTCSASAVLAFPILKSAGPAAFIGCLIALSSTAVVLRILQERAEVDTPHGQSVLGILIFQDLSVVLIILLTPLMAGKTGNLAGTLLVLAFKGAAVIVSVFLCAKWVAPKVFYQIAKLRSQTIFLLFVIVMCFSIAWLTAKAGLSLALGAFLAGLIISETEYSHQALGNILPFREVFSSLFFISIGMLLDLQFLLEHPFPVLCATGGVIVLKTVLGSGTAFLIGLPLRTSLLAGFAIAQIGEFSFILARIGVGQGLLDSITYQMFLAVSILSMAATPFLIALSPRFADLLLRLPFLRRLQSGVAADTPKLPQKNDHLIIVGFGVNGKNVARSAEIAGIPYVVIEMNPTTVLSERESGRPIVYGDASQEAVLAHTNLAGARIAVVAINDPVATRRITETIKRLNPAVHLLVRSRYLQEMKPLYDLGADEVIPEEFETSVEIFTRVLSKYLVPRQEIENLTAEIRADNYEMLRRLSKGAPAIHDFSTHLPDVEISAVRISGESWLVGKSLSEIGFRRRYSVTVLAIRRDSEMLSNPAGEIAIGENDVLILMGTPDHIREIAGVAEGKGG